MWPTAHSLGSATEEIEINTHLKWNVWNTKSWSTLLKKPQSSTCCDIKQESLCTHSCRVVNVYNVRAHVVFFYLYIICEYITGFWHPHRNWPTKQHFHDCLGYRLDSHIKDDIWEYHQSADIRLNLILSLSSNFAISGWWERYILKPDKTVGRQCCQRQNAIGSCKYTTSLSNSRRWKNSIKTKMVHMFE